MRNKGLLLDRDGVINIDHNFVATRDRFDFVPGIFDFLRKGMDLGYRLAVVTNQSGVGRGYYTRADFETLTGWMTARLRDEGIVLSATFSCFDHPQAEDPLYRRQSFWRKPAPGMVLDAAQRLHLDLGRSVMVGDKASDMRAAMAGGVARRLWLTPDADAAMDGVQIVRDFTEASMFL